MECLDFPLSFKLPSSWLHTPVVNLGSSPYKRLLSSNGLGAAGLGEEEALGNSGHTGLLA